MEGVIKAVMMLSVVASCVAVHQVPAYTFRCVRNSPTTPPATFSKTEPPVALTHIFCGEIDNKNGKASGFHSRYLSSRTLPAGRPPAKVTGRISQGCRVRKLQKQCPFDGEVTKIWNGNINSYVTKDNHDRPTNKFFPDAWKPRRIVNIAVEIYTICMGGKMTLGPDDVCIKNFKAEHCTYHEVSEFSITIFTDGANIISAFPTKNDPNCRCDYDKHRAAFQRVMNSK